MPSTVLAPSQVHSQRMINRNRGYEWPVGIDSTSPHWPLAPTDGSTLTVGHYWRWNEGWADDDGLMQAFRGAVAFPLRDLEAKVAAARPGNVGITWATLHFSMLGSAVQVGDYESPVIVTDARSSVLESIFAWTVDAPLGEVNFFQENSPLRLDTHRRDSGGRPFPRFDDWTQNAPYSFQMEKVNFPKVPIHVPGAPFVTSYLREERQAAFRVNASGTPIAEYWVDVTEQIAILLSRIARKPEASHPRNVEEAGFILAQSTEDLRDPDTDVTNIQMSQYGDFRLAVSY